MSRFLRYLAAAFSGLAIAITLVVLAGLAVVWHYSQDLPDYDQLAEYEPRVMTRVYAQDGELIGEFARERRLFAPITAIPDRVIHAFLSAEDKNFYEHRGLDPRGIMRAAYVNVRNKIAGSGGGLQGASTITQQVTKNFLLSSERRIERKIKEALLAIRIEGAFSKDQILELYLNDIYLGSGSYGVVSAALTYFNKSLNELTVDEAAYLAALPKKPSYLHPVRNRDEAIARRNWVIDQMQRNGYVTAAEAAEAQARPLAVTLGLGRPTLEATYFVEEIRRELNDRFGEDALYGGGLDVRSTFDRRLQALAAGTLRDGLIAYDEKQGWRGPVTTADLTQPGWEDSLAEIEDPSDLDGWHAAIVTDVTAREAVIRLQDGLDGVLRTVDMQWARPALEDGRLGPEVGSADDVLAPGDIVFVSRPADSQGAEPAQGDVWQLRQIPAVNGAMVVMDVDSGAVRALQGGFSFGVSEFNRATQAQRQPGSAFKPFVYAAALDNGFTPASIVVDTAVTVDQGIGQKLWKPGNYADKFYGPSTLRLGIEKSRNLMTIRIAQDVGMQTIADYAQRLGISDTMPTDQLSMALGAGETTVMKMTAAYATLANGGKRVMPTLIERIHDRRGETVFQADPRDCQGCAGELASLDRPPQLQDVGEQVLDPVTAYQIVSMLEGVVTRGTASKLRKLGLPLAGKTGTTNEAKDAWFIGFTPDLVVGVYVGFDSPRSLGERASGGSIAAPIFGAFIAEAVGDIEQRKFVIPQGVDFIPIDAKTGIAARSPDGEGVIVEAFRVGTSPNEGTASAVYLVTEEGDQQAGRGLTTGSGGLY